MNREIIELLRIQQAGLGNSRDRCDEGGKKLWDRIDAALNNSGRPRPCNTLPVYKDDEPRHFAVLHAAYRDPMVPMGTPGAYYEVARDEPLANEFRAHMHQQYGMGSFPLGSCRETAEMLIHKLNSAYEFGLVQAALRAKGRPPREVLVGRMGHMNRNEELMP